MLLSFLLAQIAAPAAPARTAISPSAAAQVVVMLVDAPVPDMPGRRIRLRRVNGTLVLSVTGIGAPYETSVTTIRDVLGLLADRRAEPIWAALLAEHGADLTRLRDLRLAEARAIVRRGGTRLALSPAASSVRPRLRAVMLLADEMRYAGQKVEAMRVLRDARGAGPAKGGWGEPEWTAASLRLATVQTDADDLAGAAATLDDAERVLPPGSDYRVNFAINRAAMSAGYGSAADALDQIDRARSAFDTQNSTRDAEKVSGSDRHFDWIRACALIRLGRRAEAAPIVTRLTGNTVDPTDPDFFIHTNSEVLYKLSDCTRDVDLAARVLAQSTAIMPVGGLLFTALQPALGGRYDPAFLAALRSHPALAPILRARFRTLPPALEPALNAWSPPAPPRVLLAAATP